MKRYLLQYLAGSLAASVALTAYMPSAFAAREDDAKTLFNQINAANKGALGPNTYQLPTGQKSVLQGGAISSPPKNTAFVVAFRSDSAAKLAALGFYLGNHFTSNYWELHNKYLATPEEQAAKAFNQNQAAFVANAAMAADSKAMMRYTMLEMFYIERNPTSHIARGANQRGTADGDAEAKYFGLLAEELAKQMTTPADYLAFYEAERRIGGPAKSKDNSIAGLRDKVAVIFDRMQTAEMLPVTTLDPFQKIRNSIHNYMTPDVVGRIDQYLGGFSALLPAQDVADIQSLKASIQQYYTIDKKAVLSASNAIAPFLPAGALALVGGLSDRGNTVDRLEALSFLTTQARESFFQSRNPAVVSWIVTVNRFIAMELSSRSLSANDDWAARARISLDEAYASGIIAADVWNKNRSDLAHPQLQDAAYMSARKNELSSVFSTAQFAIADAFKDALADWAVVAPKVTGFTDDTLRSSSLIELDQITQLLAKTLPPSTAKFTIENEGEGYGYLIFVPKGASADVVESLQKTSIPVFEQLPIDLGVVSGIVTEEPQTPLSHVNIKSKARGTPNVYYPNAANDPIFADLLKRKALVKLTLKNGQINVREATLAEAQASWRSMRAPIKVVIKSIPTNTVVRSTKELYSKDILTCGSKASNYGEAERILPDGVMREGLCIPFGYYKEYMDTNKYDATRTFAQRAKEIINDPRAVDDHDYLVAALKDLQAKMVEDTQIVNPKLIADVTARLNTLYPGLPMRFRSSTNSEDLVNFSGAGLYDSAKYDPTKPKKSMAITLKKVWASVWNVRAWDEREHYGIPHQDVYMGILVSTAYETELANGVAVTRNVPMPALGHGMYINAQVGQDAVTNPDPKISSEELLVLDKPDKATGLAFTVKYLKKSSLSPEKVVLAPEEAIQLAKYLAIMHKHFKKIFDPKGTNPKFALDCEWKLDDLNGAGHRDIFLKQARPYIE